MNDNYDYISQSLSPGRLFGWHLSLVCILTIGIFWVSSLWLALVFFVVAIALLGRYGREENQSAQIVTRKLGEAESYLKASLTPKALNALRESLFVPRYYEVTKEINQHNHKVLLVLGEIIDRQYLTPEQDEELTQLEQEFMAGELSPNFYRTDNPLLKTFKRLLGEGIKWEIRQQLKNINFLIANGESQIVHEDIKRLLVLTRLYLEDDDLLLEQVTERYGSFPLEETGKPILFPHRLELSYIRPLVWVTMLLFLSGVMYLQHLYLIVVVCLLTTLGILAWLISRRGHCLFWNDAHHNLLRARYYYDSRQHSKARKYLKEAFVRPLGFPYTTSLHEHNLNVIRFARNIARQEGYQITVYNDIENVLNSAYKDSRFPELTLKMLQEAFSPQNQAEMKGGHKETIEPKSLEGHRTIFSPNFPIQAANQSIFNEPTEQSTGTNSSSSSISGESNKPKKSSLPEKNEENKEKICHDENLLEEPYNPTTILRHMVLFILLPSVIAWYAFGWLGIPITLIAVYLALNLYYKITGDYLINLLINKGNIDKALDIGKKSSRFSLRYVPGPRYPESLIKIGEIYYKTGNGPEAIKYTVQAEKLSAKMSINTLTRSARKPHLEIHAKSLYALGLLHDTIGNFNESKLYLLYTCAICREIGKQELLANSLQNLGVLYLSIRDLERAQEVLEEAALIYSSKLYKKYYVRGYIATQVHFAILFSDTKELQKVEQYLNNAEKMYQQLGEISINYVWFLDQSAFILIKAALLSGQWDNSYYEEAIRRLKEAIDLFGYIHHDDGDPYFKTDLKYLPIINLGWLFQLNGDYNAARKCHFRMAKVFKHFPREQLKRGDLYPTNLFHRMTLAVAQGNIEKGYQLAKEFVELENNRIKEYFGIITERQQLRVLKLIWSNYSKLLSLLMLRLELKTGSTMEKIAVQEAYQLVLQRKGIIIDVLAKMKKKSLSLQENEPELATMMGKLNHLRQVIAKHGTDDKETIGKWQEEKDRLEARITQKFPSVGNIINTLIKSDYEQIANRLPDGAALIEYVRLSQFQFKSRPFKGEPQWAPPEYMAFVITTDSPRQLVLVKLGSATKIDNRIKWYRKCVYSGPRLEKRINPIGIRLRQSIFDPLQPYLKNAKRILIVPDGNLSRLPFSALPGLKKSYLIDEFRISYLSTSRDLISQEEPQEERPKNQPSVVGGVADNIPMSRVECEKVAQQLGVEPIVGSNATEARLKTCVAPHILHISTHGFFDKSYRYPLFVQLTNDVEWNTHLEGSYTWAELENPLLKVGFQLAEYDPKKPQRDEIEDESDLQAFRDLIQRHLEEEDGIVTGEDLLSIDLNGTELLVLSLCGSALGKITTGEGIFGLRRAAKLAGAKTLVMSLWNINDLSAVILMNRFYNNLLDDTKNMERDEALREAQRYVRDLTVGEIKENEKWLMDIDTRVRKKLNINDRAILSRIKNASGIDETRPFANVRHWGLFICQGQTTRGNLTPSQK